MIDRSNVAQVESMEKPELAAAREELSVLETLAEGVSAKIVEYSKRPQFQGKIDNIEISLQENRYAQLKAYEELARVCYGRTVLGTEVDDNDRLRASFAYRITQANIGYVHGGCFVLARNSPLATGLVTALPNDQRDITVNKKDRFFNIDEVRSFEGPTSLRSSQKPNFRSMSIRTIGSKRPVVLGDIRSAVYRLVSHLEIDVEGLVPPTELPPSSELDPTWLDNWSGVYFGEAEELSLGHQFFTQTTVDQERALNNPRGLTFVEGIAGSGKTSVALGRLKFFANFATGAEREYYGLQNAPENDFSPGGMVGFVLSHSLKRYLKETANALGLEHLPIRDFEELKTDLSVRFGIAEKFRRKKGESSSLRSRVNWLRAVDAAMARAAGTRLLENLTRAKDVPKLVMTDISRMASDLVRAEPHPNSKSFNLSGLLARIAGAIADAELRAREAGAHEEFRPRGKIGTPQYEQARRSLESEMRRIQQEAEKKIVSPLSLSLMSALTAHELIVSAIGLDEFPTLVRQSFGHPADSAAIQELEYAVTEIRALFREAAARPTLADPDLVMLVILAAMIADGFDYVDRRGSLKNLYQIRRNTAIFIDEVQDFTESEILLMGLTATGGYNQITLSGDRCQRLQSSGAQSYNDLFPWVPRAQHNSAFFLDQNFRQRPELATLSLALRSLVQSPVDADSKFDSSGHCATVYEYGARERMSDYILQKIRALPQNATIAIISPTTDEVKIWFDLLEEELGANHRTALMSRRDDLTRRFNVHFTEVRETKGLEFNVVIVPDIGSFALDSDLGRNQAYVAISRAKHALILGCHAESVEKAEIGALRRNNILCVRELPPAH
jgi:hypothetical protein